MRRVVVPFGVALAFGVVVAYLVPPHWRAGGLPYVLGYGKNVEHACVTAAFLAAAASVWLWEARRGRWLLGVLAAGGFALLAVHADPSALLAVGPHLVPALLVFIALRLSARSESHEVAALLPGRDLPLPAAALVLAALAIAAFIVSLQALDIDVYHHGEVLASAVDLVRGGRPFETFVWPHGFHDTGLTALWILATGKIGTSPIALAQATCRALGVVSAFALAFRLVGSRAVALAAPAGLVFALVVRANAPGPGVTLHQLGVLVFVALGFAVLLAPRSELFAGALFGLAYLFRVETGVYAAFASLALLASRDFFEEGALGKESLRRFASSVLQLAAGAAATLVLFRLTLGWPGQAWFSYTLLDLPRYHRDSAGLPFPWPLRGIGPGVPLAAVGMGLGALVFALLLVIEAARQRTSSSLWFFALFAALATRSTLDRSDEGHLLQWHALPVLAAILLAAAGLRARFGWSALRTSLVIFLVLGWLDIGGLTIPWPGREGVHSLASRLASPLAQLREHLRPNPPVGSCRDASFTPTEAGRDPNRRFIEATCEVEGLLRAHHVTELVIAHSAPWYYVRFGLTPPTRYFAFARAYTPEQQRALIHDLRARRPQALLRVQGFGALGQIDVPDVVRVPLVDAYLRERRRGVVLQSTPIGDLYFWNEPKAALEPPRSGVEPAASGLGIAVDGALYVPANGLFFAEGWAADVSRPQPLKALEPESGRSGADDGWVSLEYGRPRPDLGPDCGPVGNSACGFEYAAVLSPKAFAAFEERGFIGLTAVTAEGATAPVEMTFAKLRVLGELAGDAWSDLGLAVREAAALGAADRDAAAGSRR